MAGMRETQLTADVELLSSTVETKNKQHTRPPISMNFEVGISVHGVAKLYFKLFNSVSSSDVSHCVIFRFLLLVPD